MSTRAPDIFEVSLHGEIDLDAAEAAPCAGFQLAGSRPPWIAIRTWSAETRLYRSLVRHLDPEQQVITLGPPVGEHKHDFPRTVDAWTKDCLAKLALVSARDPLRLGGWSFGGVLALETARKLEGAGRRVEQVIMLDTRLPKAHPEEGRLSRSLPHAFVHHIDELFGMAPARRRAYLRERVEWQLYHARRRWYERIEKQFGRPAPDLERPDGRRPEVRDTSSMSPLQKALWVAYLKYQPEPCSIPVTQFWCAETCRRVEDSSLGWSRFLRGPVENVPVPGGHMTLFDEEHARILGPALQRTLDTVVRDRA
jgi:thioesterase domain-containing protein